MTHIEQGNYAGKHPKDTQPDPVLTAEIKKRAVDGRLACIRAAQIAREHHVSMAEVGLNADLVEIKISACLLGLFGHHRGEPVAKGRIVKPAAAVDHPMKQAISAATVDGKLTCESAWNIAERLSTKRIEVCAAAETLEIKISKCQLGVF